MICSRALHLLIIVVAAIITLPMNAQADNGVFSGAPRGQVEWKRPWDRFTPAEGALTTLATVGTYVVDRRLPNPTEAKVDFEVPLLDPGVRGLVRFRSAEDQATWAQWSDIGYRVMVLYPYIVDAGIMALGVHRNPDVAAQLFLIDLESFTLAGFAHHTISRLTSRPRPFVQDCADDGRSTRYKCGEVRDVRSFYAGHASAAFTSAGLTCLHHQHIPLWGGGAPDAWACIWALSFASFTSLARMTSDEHWASDTVIGIGTGWLFGYLMPRWLHYGSGKTKPYSLVGRVLPFQGSSLVWAPTFTASADGGVIGVRTTL
jgi:hypothetical protein